MAPMTDPVAVVDIGTISTRLLVAGPAGPEVREATITRTGEGLRATKQISTEAIERLGACLRSYRQQIDQAGAVETRAIATSVARDAINRNDLVDVVRSTLDVEVDVVSGDREAVLAFRGAVDGLDPILVDDRSMILVIDIGGGSTEFSIGSRRDGFECGYSADMGAARLTDAYLPSDPPRADELSAALSIVELHVDDVRREVPGLADALGSSGLVVGVGGTLSTMAAVEIGLPGYDRDRLHGFVLDRPAAEDVFRTLATESAADRAFNPGLEADRVDLIVGGACVVVETMRQLDIEAITVSQSDMIDAVAAEALESR